MKLHKEGYSILMLSFIIFSLIIIGLFYLIDNQWLNIISVVLLSIIYVFLVWFFRNPDRETNANTNDVVAPVDGKVVEVKKVFVDEYLNQECWQVSIFMSPLNVHVCRYPVSGKVVYNKYHAGKYLVAFHPKSSELNERTTVVVESENQKKVLFRQIAGALARRIVIYTKNGDLVNSGTEYGFIKFGSRLDVFLPVDTEIITKIGDKPVGGKDIIARLNP